MQCALLWMLAGFLAWSLLLLPTCPLAAVDSRGVPPVHAGLQVFMPALSSTMTEGKLKRIC